MTFYFLLYGVLALWVLCDGLNRKLGFQVASWAIGTLVIGPVVLPVYLASRPLKVGEVREGGKAWNVLKNFAILWTIVVAIMTIVTLTTAGDSYAHSMGNAESVGAGIGMLLVLGILAAIWFFPTVGAAVIGFLLKKNSIIEHGPTVTEGAVLDAATLTGRLGLGIALILAAALIASVAVVGHATEKARERADHDKVEAAKQATAAKQVNDAPFEEASRKKHRAEYVEEFNRGSKVIEAKVLEDELIYVFPDSKKNLSLFSDDYLDSKMVSRLCGYGFKMVLFHTPTLRQVVHRSLDCPSTDH